MEIGCLNQDFQDYEWFLVLSELGRSGNVRVSRAHYSTLLGLGKVETIEVHDLVPCCYEVSDKRLLRIITPVDLRNGSELGA